MRDKVRARIQVRRGRTWATRLLSAVTLATIPTSAVGVSATGAAVGPVARVGPTTLTFGDQPVGTMSQPRSVTLTNAGDQTLTVSTVGIRGANPVDFRLGADGCSGRTLAPGVACSINIGFAPTVGGQRSAELAIVDNAPDSPQTVVLAGNGTTPAVALDPPTLDFGDQAVGTGSIARNVTVRNTGGAPLQVGAVTLTGADPADFQIRFDGCTGRSVVPGNGCSLAVGFAPTATGPRAAALDVHDDAAGSPHAVPLSGNGTPPPAVALDPTSLGFGEQEVGTESGGQVVKVTNTGGSTLFVTSVTMGGSNPGDFRVVTEDCRVSAGIAVGSSCAVSVAFAPAAGGPRESVLAVADNAPGSPHAVPLRGTGVMPPAPLVALAPSSLDFGFVAAGSASADKAVTVRNDGDAALELGTATISDPTYFGIAMDTCSSAVVAPGASCAISVGFAPRLTGPRSTQLTIPSNAPGSPHIVALTGTGTAVSMRPDRLSFGDQAVSSASAPQTVRVHNGGVDPVTINSVGLAGPTAGEFRIRSSDCFQVPPNGSCSVSVAFAPTAPGPRDATLVVTHNSIGSPHRVPLSGHGTIVAVTISPSSLAFGDQATGTTGSARAVRVTNTGNATLIVSSVTVSGTHAGDFPIDENTCGGASGVAPQGSCTVSVRFAPTAAGSRSAALVFNDNAPQSPDVVLLGGTGTVPPAPAVTLSASTLSFGDQAQGTTSDPRTVTVTNTGNASLTVSSVALAGADAADYSIGSGTCGSGAVAPGDSCAITVAFAPTAPGTRNATLAISDDAPGSPHTVALGGNGILRADVGVSIGATPNPVRTGTTLTYTITVSNFGPSPATGVVLTETLPSGSKFVGYTASVGTRCNAPAPGATGTLTCSLGSVPVGSAAVQVQVKVVAPGGSSVSNTAAVTSSSSDPNPANDSATVSTPVFGRK